MNNIVLTWNQKAIEILNLHDNPGDDARRMATLHIAIHNTLNNINRRYYLFDEPIQNEKPPEGVNMDAAVSGAAYKVLKWVVKNLPPNPFKYTPEKIASKDNELDNFKNEVLGNINYNRENIDNSFNYGFDLANRLLDERVDIDGRDKFDDLSVWETVEGPYLFRPDYYEKVSPPPTFKEFDKFLEHWGENVVPFCTKNNVQFQKGGPWGAIMPDLYMEQVEEVRKYGVKEEFQTDAVKEYLRDSYYSTIYWADIRSHVVWNDFAIKVIDYKNTLGGFPKYGIYEIARILVLIHTAMADGASAVLNDIYKFNHWRPVTAMRYYGFKLRKVTSDIFSPRTIFIDWVPFIEGVPRVPEYPSGFGVLGGAVGTILRGILGNEIDISIPVYADLNIEDALNKRGGKILKYQSILEAVHDNALTKINCGWNFKKSALDGIDQGQHIGGYILANYFKEYTQIPKGAVSTEASSINKERLSGRYGG